MGGKIDKAEGKVKEAAGVLAGDKRLERDGKVQHAAGHVKEKAGEIVYDVKKATEKVVDKVKKTLKR